ncbi:MAG: hypothetical protein O2819_02020 [Planctomycetota bacterium]|nr:hypothetical protein [Planctomycetota bacterium]MDA1105525.1 hypothetical protein [Planctomycetota bacterium]
MDRKRLSQVQTSDLSESRVNDDFLFWLKNSGPNYLLAVLLVACAYLGWNWWQQTAEAARGQVWSEFAACTVPQELIDLAAAHPEEQGLAIVAQVSAGDMYLQSIVSGVRFDREASAADAALDDATRKEWIDAALLAYASAIEAAKGQPETAQLAIPALFGVAALNEETGAFDGARRALEQARELAGTKYGTIVAVVDARLASMDTLANPYPVAPAPVAPAALPAIPTADDALNTILGSDSSATAPAPAPAPVTAPAP